VQNDEPKSCSAEIALAIIAVAILLAYLVGSIPTAYLVVRLVKGTDIRTVGSRNVGALNTFRQLGVAAGISVLILDATKGALGYFLPIWMGAPEWAAYISATAAVVGHNWPIYLRFRGGKGAAAILGIGLAMAPIPAIIGLLIAIVLAAITRHVVTAALLGFIIFNIVNNITQDETSKFIFGLLLTILVVGTYLSRSFKPILVAVHQRKWQNVLFPK
jgi:glycerol-3-phosphate acyltransferase PlsY